MNKLNSILRFFGGMLILPTVANTFILIWTFNLFYLQVELTLLLSIVITYFLDQYTSKK